MDLLRRFLRLARGFVGLFIGDLEGQSPEALLEAGKQDYRRRVAQYHQSLARIAGVGERLKLQIENKVAKSKILDQRILANLKAGNSELAGSLARELNDLKSDLEVDVRELQETEEAYQGNLKSIKLLHHDFAEKVKRLERQLDRVKVKEAQAEAVSGLSGVSFSIADLGDTLKGVEDLLEKKLETSAGKLRLVRDLTAGDGLEEVESERRVMEQRALADFMAQRGLPPEAIREPIGLPAPLASQPVSKESG